MTREAIRIGNNDISCAHDFNIIEHDIEEYHHEDTYQENRLNKEIDIHNIDMKMLINLVE